VREDFLSGVRSGVNGTPTFFINGVRHDDSYELETLLAAVEAAMPSWKEGSRTRKGYKHSFIYTLFHASYHAK